MSCLGIRSSLVICDHYFPFIWNQNGLLMPIYGTNGSFIQRIKMLRSDAHWVLVIYAGLTAHKMLITQWTHLKYAGFNYMRGYQCIWTWKRFDSAEQTQTRTQTFQKKIKTCESLMPVEWHWNITQQTNAERIRDSKKLITKFNIIYLNTRANVWCRP